MIQNKDNKKSLFQFVMKEWNKKKCYFPNLNIFKMI